MGTTVEEYINRMRTAPDTPKPGDEWDIVEELLSTEPNGFDAILEWIFAHHKGYIGPRARAGLKYLERNPIQGLTVVEHLVGSNDPDDRDTAITVLEQYGVSATFYLVKPLLKDVYTYLQFEAIELLKDVYPDEVKITLQELANHKTARVREAAQKLMLKTDKNIWE